MTRVRFLNKNVCYSVLYYKTTFTRSPELPPPHMVRRQTNGDVNFRTFDVILHDGAGDVTSVQILVLLHVVGVVVTTDATLTSILSPLNLRGKAKVLNAGFTIRLAKFFGLAKH